MGRERETWTLHHWTTTLDITTAVDIATLHNIGQQPWTLQPLTTKMLWTLHQWTRALDIASLGNNIGHYNCCGHCINGQQHWTTTFDITAINNKKAVDIASMDNNIGHCCHQANKKKERERLGHCIT